MPFQAMGDNGQGIASINASSGPIQIKEIVIRGINAFTLIYNTIHFSEYCRIYGLDVPITKE